jgi:hypothetical protein
MPSEPRQDGSEPKFNCADARSKNTSTRSRKSSANSLDIFDAKWNNWTYLAYGDTCKCNEEKELSQPLRQPEGGRG